MKKFISLFTTALVFLFATNTVSARLIEGEINFDGSTAFTQAGTSGTVAQIIFAGVAVSDSFPALGIDAATGDFDGLEGAVFPTLVFNAIDVSVATPFIFWAVDSFTFSIASITENEYSSGTPTSALLAGTGIISSSDALLDDTPGVWKVTADGASFSSTTASATEVPAPAGTALLGLALLGFGFARRHHKA